MKEEKSKEVRASLMALEKKILENNFFKFDSKNNQNPFMTYACTLGGVRGVIFELQSALNCLNLKWQVVDHVS